MVALKVITLAAAVLATACGSSVASQALLDDRSYDRIEQLRGERAIDADRSYDRIEELRTQRSVANVAVDDSYDRLEAHRAERAK